MKLEINRESVTSLVNKLAYASMFFGIVSLLAIIATCGAYDIATPYDQQNTFVLATHPWAMYPTVIFHAVWVAISLIVAEITR